jgi:hypothetical protein
MILPHIVCAILHTSIYSTAFVDIPESLISINSYTFFPSRLNQIKYAANLKTLGL